MDTIHILEKQKNFKYSSNGKTLYRIARNKLYVYELEDKDEFGPGEFYHFSYIRDYVPTRDWYLFD